MTSPPDAIRAPIRPLVLACLGLAAASFAQWRVEARLDPEAWRRALAGVAGGVTGEVWAAVSDLGYGVVVAAIILMLVSLRPDPRQLQNLLVASVASLVLGTAIKAAVGRLRPDMTDTASWPSGHSSIALAVALGLVAGRRTRAAAIALAVAVGVARVLSLRHWPADVLGGFALGCAIAAFTWSLRLRVPLRPVDAGIRLWAAGAFALLAVWSCAIHPFELRARHPLTVLCVLVALAASLRDLARTAAPAEPAP